MKSFVMVSCMFASLFIAIATSDRYGIAFYVSISLFFVMYVLVMKKRDKIDRDFDKYFKD